jgi:uncharacterized membrane protein
MNRLATWGLVALVFAGLVFVAATAGSLPERVATHFAAGGAANGWMTRGGYTVFALALTAGLPLSVFLAVGVMPARFERFTNLPHRDYWLAPRQRERTIAWLRGFGARLGMAFALLAVGLHAAILEANARTPPRLNEPVFIAGLVMFVALVAAAVIVLQVKFRNVPQRR